ncbi:hypothetical protein L1887_25632 [Cichorium endivia]|nr:hypothetical protein L1887_25632 [Cichorium endivia]
MKYAWPSEQLPATFYFPVPAASATGSLLSDSVYLLMETINFLQRHPNQRYQRRPLPLLLPSRSPAVTQSPGFLCSFFIHKLYAETRHMA